MQAWINMKTIHKIFQYSVHLTKCKEPKDSVL